MRACITHTYMNILHMYLFALCMLLFVLAFRRYGWSRLAEMQRSGWWNTILYTSSGLLFNNSQPWAHRRACTGTRWKTEATPKADALERARGRCSPYLNAGNWPWNEQLSQALAMPGRWSLPWHQGAASQGLSTLSAPRLKRCFGTGLGETSIAISKLSKQKKERSFTLPTLSVGVILVIVIL